MNNKSIFKFALLMALAISLFASCDKDFNEIGNDVIGGDHFLLKLDTLKSVVAYNQGTGFVQTNNLAVNPLGVLVNPAFGNTTSSFVTQVQLANVTTTFGANVVIDSVYLTVPYFSHTDGTTNGVTKYLLDSTVVSSGTPKFKLSLYESGYAMNDFDPDSQFQEPQRFYNNQFSLFENNKRGAAADGSSILNGDPINNGATNENTAFFFNGNEYNTITVSADKDTTLTRNAPAMRLKLNNNYFKKKIVEAPVDKLTSNNAFKDYFRGLYFKVEAVDAGSSMAMINFAKGNITVYYKEDKVTTTGTIKVSKTFVLNLTGNTVSLQNQENTNPNYIGSLAANGPETPAGDSRLYLKGGEGSVAIIDLFGADGPDEGTVPDELDAMREEGWLINEANLIFTVEQDDAHKYATKKVGDKELSVEPERIYLYDVTNKRPIYDYSVDASTYTSDVKRNKYVFGGIRQHETTSGLKKGTQYKIRITNYIRNLIKYKTPPNDSTNVRLGVAVTESIGIISNARIKPQVNTPIVSPIDRIPTGSAMNPFGTILYGSFIPPTDANYKKRLKLEIHYTIPNSN